MLIAGKMSVGIRIRINGVIKTNTNAATTKVYGRFNARRTIHIKFKN